LVLKESRPASLSIPRIGLHSDIISLGQQEDGTLEVSPEEAGSPAGWYVNSPTPGERGPSILLGHVNSLGGSPGIFARLQELVPGDDVGIERADGTTAVFRVTAVKRYDKDSFPRPAGLREYHSSRNPSHHLRWVQPPERHLRRKPRCLRETHRHGRHGGAGMSGTVATAFSTRWKGCQFGNYKQAP
jgi:hypothetical protein